MKILYYKQNKWLYMDWDDVKASQSLYTAGLHTLDEYIEDINEHEYVVENISDFIMDLVYGAENTDLVYVSELDRFYKDIVSDLRENGYTYTRERNFKTMKSMEYNNLVSAQKGIGVRCYYIKVKTTSHSKIMFYDLQKTITGYESEIAESYMQDTNSICYAYLHAIHLLNAQTEKITKSKMTKVPFTITKYANRCLRSMVYRKNIVPISDDTIPEELYVRDLSEKHNIMSDSIDWFVNAYHGGINWKKHGNKVCKYLSVYVYDYNSLYPYAMEKPLPFGKIYHNYGQPTESEFEAVRKGMLCMWVRVVVDISLKEGKVPFIHCNTRKFKDTDRDVWLNNEKFKSVTEPIVNSNGKIECTLCYPDYFMMIKNYSINFIEFTDYCTSSASNKIFERYIDKFYEAKSKQKGAARITSKRLLVTVYGTMCKSRVNYNILEDYDEKKPYKSYNKVSYIHIGGYIASWARYIWLSGAEKLDTLHYGDTDSYHTTKKYKCLKCSNKLGDLKIEGTADEGYYFKKKCYVHLSYKPDGLEVKITKAGASKESITNLENIISSFYNDYNNINTTKESIHKVFSEKEGYDYDKTERFMSDIKSIVESGEYERMMDLEIPVYYKKNVAPYQYNKVIVWEKFTYSVLDDIM